MQLAILLVLILIAILIAPWLIGVIVALVALYGAWIVVGAITVGAIVVTGMAVIIILEKARKTASSRSIDLQIAEANHAYRERMESVPVEAPALEKKVSKTLRTKPCPSCEGNVPVGSLYCPSCGKLVPAKKM